MAHTEKNAQRLHARLRQTNSSAKIDLVQRFDDFDDAQDTALHALRSIQEKNGMDKSHTAVVFDIDQTILFYHDRTQGTASVSYDLPNIATMVSFMHKVRKFARIFVITARLDTKDVRAITIAELKKHGVTTDHFDALFLCPRASRASPAGIASFKAKTRKIIQKAYAKRILMTVGDRFGDHLHVPFDIDGHHTEGDAVLFRVRNHALHATVICFKLPL